MSRAWIVGAAGDPLVRGLPAALLQRGCPCSVVAPERLGDLRLTLAPDACFIEGEPVAAIVFRAATNAPFSASFPEGDQAFCDAETRAAWLGALHTPGLQSFNRLDAIAWFETEHWTVWRRVLAQAGVPLARCEYGYGRSDGARVWVPFTAAAPQPDPGETIARAAGTPRFAEQRFTRTLVACGAVLAGPRGPAVERALRALDANGVALAEIVTDEQGDVAWVDTLPRDLSAAQAELVIAALAERIAGSAR